MISRFECGAGICTCSFKGEHRAVLRGTVNVEGRSEEAVMSTSMSIYQAVKMLVSSIVTIRGKQRRLKKSLSSTAASYALMLLSDT